MVSIIENDFPQSVKTTKPEGGMFLWLELPNNMSSTELFEKAYEENVAFVPGMPFYAVDAQENTLRLNYSNSDISSIEKGMKALGSLIAKSIAE